MVSLPRLLILSHTRASSDPRVFRQLAGLRDKFEITLAALDAPSGFKDKFLHFTPRARSLSAKLWWAGNLLLGNSGPYLHKWQLTGQDKLAAQKFDIVLVNDMNPLPLAFHLAKGAPVVFDAHEYYPEEFSGSRLWRLLFRRHYVQLCEEYIPRCAAMTTVCPGLAELYQKHFGARPTVIRNAPEYEELAPSPPLGGGIRLIHHGGASKDRRIEDMIALMDMLDERFTLDLMLVGKGAYLNSLRALAAKNPRIAWREPVAMREISLAINNYDLGLYILPPSNINNTYALPNKFFEFMQARLGIAIGPSPEMARLVKEHDLGVVAKDFSLPAMAEALNALTVEDIARFKQNSHQAARLFNAKNEMDKLANLLKDTLAQAQA